MKILIACGQCMLGTTSIEEAERAILLASPSSSGHVKGTCSVGHQFDVWIQNEWYELLFESACIALEEDFYLEAVGGFASSLESFYGCAIRVLAFALKCDESAVFKVLKRTRLSERQYGAFQWLWLAAVGKPAQQIDEEKIGKKTLRNIRNDVVHCGYYPSEDEARRYSELVFSFLKEGHEILKSRYPEEVRKVGWTRHPKVQSSTVYLPTILDTVKDHKNSFRSSVRKLELQLRMLSRAD